MNPDHLFWLLMVAIVCGTIIALAIIGGRKP